jgi:hypothetical protein
LKKGLDHFAGFLGAARTDLTALPPDLVRNYAKASL